MTDSAFAFGLGVGTRNSKGEWLEVFFPRPLLAPPASVVTSVRDCASGAGLDTSQLRTLQTSLAAAGAGDQAELAGQLLDSGRPAVAVLLREDAPPANVPEGYLKLHLLSHRLVKPHGTNLQGLFGILPNVAWTSQGLICPRAFQFCSVA